MKKFIGSVLALLVLASVSFAGPFRGRHCHPVANFVNHPVHAVARPVSRVVGTVGNVVSYPVTGTVLYQGVFSNGGCANGKCSTGR